MSTSFKNCEAGTFYGWEEDKNDTFQPGDTVLLQWGAFDDESTPLNISLTRPGGALVGDILGAYKDLEWHMQSNSTDESRRGRFVQHRGLNLPHNQFLLIQLYPRPVQLDDPVVIQHDRSQISTRAFQRVDYTRYGWEQSLGVSGLERNFLCRADDHNDDYRWDSHGYSHSDENTCKQ